MTPSMTREWLRIAHRGASGEAPEHTGAAFRRALGYAVDMIELDVHVSRDHELIVIHDDSLERTTSGTGPVRDQDLRTLRILDAGCWFGPAFAGESILTLDDVIAIVGGRARLNVELKSPRSDWEHQARRVVEVLRRAGIIGSTVVSGFDPEALACVRDLSEEAQLGLLWANTDVEAAWDWARRLGAVSFHPHWMLVDAASVAAAHERHLQVIVWTVNELADMESVLAAGVDGIISDFPGRFDSIVGRGHSLP